MTNEKNEINAAEGRSDSKALLDAVHIGKILVTWNGNDAGKLWEKLWKWTETEGYQSKVCASGCFGGWHTHSDEEQFLAALQSDIREFRFAGI